MHALQWLLTLLSLSHGLKMAKMTPIRIFRKTCVGDSLPVLLHTIDVHRDHGDALKGLLASDSIPFDHFYTKYCSQLMTVSRAQSLYNLFKERPYALRLVLPAECLASMPRIPDRFWDDFDPSYMLTDHNSHILPNLPRAVMDSALQSATMGFDGPELLQSCKWICDPASHDLFLTSGMSELLDSTDGWEAIHHSCITPIEKHAVIRHSDRISHVMHWIMLEADLKDIEAGLFSVGQMMRWAVHLCLVLKRLQDIYTLFGGPAARPLYDYLQRMRTVTRPHSELVSSLIYSATAYFSRVTSSPPSLPPVLLVLAEAVKGIRTDKRAARWTLAVMELYHQHCRTISVWHIHPQLVPTILKSFKVVSPLEQAHWSQLYFETLQSLDFVSDAVGNAIRGSEDLQEWLMSSIENDKSSRRLNIALSCVSRERLLKETRLRFLKSSENQDRLHQIHRTFYPFYRRPWLDMEELCLILFRVLARYFSVVGVKGDRPICLPVLMRRDMLPSLSFIYAVSKIFAVPLPISLPDELCANLMGYSSTLFSRLWSCSDGQWVQALKHLFSHIEVHDRVLPIEECIVYDDHPPVLPAGMEALAVDIEDIFTRIDQSIYMAQEVLVPFITPTHFSSL